MTSKITPEAKTRCAAHTMQEQLEQMRALHAVELAILKKRQSLDMQDVDLAFEADLRHDCLNMPIGSVD